jgi:alginate O-acetyltransferase complex protein AlgJ
VVAQRGYGGTSPAGSVLPAVHEAWLPREHPLHRPRHGQKQRFTLISAAIFFCVPLLALILGVRPPEIENHRLADFPDPGDGWGMFTGLGPWATDHLPFRDTALNASNWVSRDLFGEPPQFDVAPAPENRQPAGPIVVPALPEPDRERPSTAGFTKVLEGRDGWLYFGDEIRWKCQPANPLDQVIGQLRRLRQAVESSGRWFVLVVAPDKSTAVPQKLPSTYAGRECAAAMRQQFWNRVVAEAGALDLRTALHNEAGRIQHEPYFPLDTHWTHEGGLVMTRAVADSIQSGISRNWIVTPSGTWHGQADLPPLIGQSAELTGQDYSLSPDGTQDRTNRTPSDFRTPLHMTSAATTGTITSPVGMFADSYAEFASPFLGAVFNDITILHSENARQDMGLAGQILRNSEVVVIEVVERHLAPGLSPITDPEFVDQMSKVLAANPRR